ncbi:MAG: metallophosphoesterase [Christensenellales bacterium]|jgi:predicted phosphohydrolase
MRIFAIGDLHLPGGSENKSMDIFGELWESHFDKIKSDWIERVSQEDVVLIPGDISWAMFFEDALHDIDAICALPGSKILLKGNHDFWWNSITRLRQILHGQTYALQNDALIFGGVAFAGSRGWEKMGEDGKIQRREIIRMELSLKAASAKSPERIVAMTHYPPFDENGGESAMTRLFQEYGVSDAVYGHLHGEGAKNAIVGERGGVRYHLAACDYLGFKLLQLP